MPVLSVCLLSDSVSSIAQTKPHHLVESLGMPGLFDILAESTLMETMYRSQREETWRYQEKITRDRDTLLVSTDRTSASSPEDSHGRENPPYRLL